MRDHGGKGDVRLGIAPHSLRAVTAESLKTALDGLAAQDETAPVHVHIAEQTKEVEDCLAWCGRRPVEWLLDEQEVDRRWCLVHATHMTEEETSRLAKSGAVAGLCPTTEANLGDGLFNAPPYIAEGGAWGIGSDSHISISPLEELRWFEYGQRLVRRRRNVLRAEAEGHIGAGLYRAALAGGAQAMGRHIGRLEEGARADLLVLDPDSPLLTGMEGDMLLDAWVFSGNASSVRDVMVGGSWVVQDRRHPKEAEIAERYRKTLKELTAA
jgi:formimidoylglutamate deiminase